jgi:hypothetical protein
MMWKECEWSGRGWCVIREFDHKGYGEARFEPATSRPLASSQMSLRWVGSHSCFILWVAYFGGGRCSTTPLVSQNIWRRVEGSLMNYKGFGTKRSWLNGGTITSFARTSCVPTEIRTKPLQNTGLEPYRYANLLDKIIIVIRDNSVDAATGWVAGVRFQAPQRPDRAWVSGCLVLNVYRRLLLLG